MRLFQTFSTFKDALQRVKSATNARIVWVMWRRTLVAQWQRKELLLEILTGSAHLVSHCEVDPKVIVAEANWKRVVKGVLKVEIDYRVPASMVWQLPVKMGNMYLTPSFLQPRHFNIFFLNVFDWQMVKIQHQMNQNQTYGAASPSEWSATMVPSASGSPPW